MIHKRLPFPVPVTYVPAPAFFRLCRQLATPVAPAGRFRSAYVRIDRSTWPPDPAAVARDLPPEEGSGGDADTPPAPRHPPSYYGSRPYGYEPQ